MISTSNIPTTTTSTPTTTTTTNTITTATTHEYIVRHINGEEMGCFRILQLYLEF